MKFFFNNYSNFNYFTFWDATISLTFKYFVWDEKVRIFCEQKFGWGSKLRTTNISKFENYQCWKLREVQLFDFFLFTKLFFHFFKNYLNTQILFFPPNFHVPIFYDFPKLIFFEFINICKLKKKSIMKLCLLGIKF